MLHMARTFRCIIVRGGGVFSLDQRPAFALIGSRIK